MPHDKATKDRVHGCAKRLAEKHKQVNAMVNGLRKTGDDIVKDIDGLPLSTEEKMAAIKCIRDWQAKLTAGIQDLVNAHDSLYRTLGEMVPTVP